jgi:hypothetical protein
MRSSSTSDRRLVTRADLHLLVFRYTVNPFAEAMRRALQREAARR